MASLYIDLYHCMCVNDLVAILKLTTVDVLQVNKKKQNLEKQEIFYHLVCWGIPGATIIGGGINGIFGHSGAWYASYQL